MADMDDASQFQFKFERYYGLGEYPENYIVGGYHPVHLGDVIQNRYRILRKLGNGQFGTVWLAKNDQDGIFVVLKIPVASEHTFGSEIDILKEIAHHPLHKGHSNVPKLLDSFELEGPNGTHDVLVLEPLGPPLAKFLEEFPSIKEDNPFRDVEWLRAISKQIVSAVDFCHTRGIIHGDIHPGNLLFDVSYSLDAEDEEALATANHVRPLKRLDGTTDAHAPRYIVDPKPLNKRDVKRQSIVSSHVTLCDFGVATTVESLAGKPFKSFGYPSNARSPEIMLGMTADPKKSDIWALGCLLFRLVAMTDLFFASGHFSRQKQGNQYLRSIMEALGPLPESMLELWNERHEIVSEDGKIVRNVPYADPARYSLEGIMAKPWFVPLSLEDASNFESFIRYIFTYEPEKRPTAAELLQHPWLNK